MKKYFYILQRSGAIHEIEDIGTRFEQAINLWQKGGIVIFPSLGMGINAVDISNIFNEEKYDDYVKNTRPREYIKNGAWYDGKENGFLRYAKWKQDEIDRTKKINTTMEEIKELPGAKERINAMIKMNLERYRVHKNGPSVG